MATKKDHPAIVGRKTIFNLDYFFQRTDESSWSLPNHATRKNALVLKISSAKNRALHHKEFCLAEGVGFEPTIRLTVYRISSPAHSTSLPPFQEKRHLSSRAGRSLAKKESVSINERLKKKERVLNDARHSSFCFIPMLANFTSRQ